VAFGDWLAMHSWWGNEGRNDYRKAEKLYITADGSSSNASRKHLWKSELQAFAKETGLYIYLSHFPGNK
jgi:hypothetical protein